MEEERVGEGVRTKGQERQDECRGWGSENVGEGVSKKGRVQEEKGKVQ